MGHAVRIDDHQQLSPYATVLHQATTTRRFRTRHRFMKRGADRILPDFRNQQVSGSSPLAGSNTINNLQGFGEEEIAAVSALCGQIPSTGPQEPAPRGNHRDRPRATPPLSRLGGRCLPFDRVWPSPIFGRAPDVRRPPPCSPGTSRHCRSGGIPRLRGQHQRRAGGSVGTGQPTSRQHPASSLRSRQTAFAYGKQSGTTRQVVRQAAEPARR